MAWVMLVWNRQPWDYKRQGPQYAPFGNINYGATGRAAGIPGAVLLWGAGAAQTMFNPRLGEGGTAFPLPPLYGPLPPFGDSRGDQFDVTQGIIFADSGVCG